MPGRFLYFRGRLPADNRRGKSSNSMTSAATSSDHPAGSNMKLFWACFIALVATSFVFGVRSELIGELAQKFNLSEADKGEILGVGLWPFAISIIAFSFIIDRI